MAEEQKTTSLETCLKLLKGQRDEQRLAGLLLVTKLCKSDDFLSLRKVYDTVSPHFLHRLLLTGMGKGVAGCSGGENRDVYLQLSITVLAAFCRVPDIASSPDMVSELPLILQVLENQQLNSPVHEECYEMLYLVSIASEDGVKTLYEAGGVKVLASQMPGLPNGSHMMELAIRLVQLMLSKLSLQTIIETYLSELTVIVATIATQFAVLHSALKFEMLHLLSAILTSESSAPLQDALRLMLDKSWSDHMRAGIVAILQNRVVSTEKHQALILADSMASIMGDGWLIGHTDLPDSHGPIPSDRCLLLVLETSRVEVSVLLNEIAYAKYGAGKEPSSSGAILKKQQSVAIAYSLVEKIIKLISNFDVNEGNQISEVTITNVIKGLNEIVGAVLDYLQDAKEHGQKKGDDLLACVRLIGSYLAEAPVASKQKVQELLGFMLSIEGEDETSPFFSICYLLPFLCQITMKVDGCKVLVSSGGHNSVVECLVKLIQSNKHMVGDNDCAFLACDTILNLLLKKEQIQIPQDESTLIQLLKAMTYWADNTSDSSVNMMASCICALLLHGMSEESLLNHPDYDGIFFNSLSQLLVRSLTSYYKDVTESAKGDVDLHDIITGAYSQWADRYPRIRGAVER